MTDKQLEPADDSTKPPPPLNPPPEPPNEWPKPGDPPLRMGSLLDGDEDAADSMTQRLLKSLLDVQQDHGSHQHWEVMLSVLRKALDKLIHEAAEWKRHFHVANEGLSDARKELTEAHAVIADIHPDNFSAFSKHGHQKTCQEALKVWKEVSRHVTITTERGLEVRASAAE